MEEIYYIWDHVSKELARDILRKMHLGEFNILNKVSDKRLILHNLVCIEREIDGDTNSAKQWSKELIDFLENEPEYIEINLEEYAKAINNYIETHKTELSKEELIKRYEFCYNVYKDCEYDTNPNGYIEKRIAQFNLNLIKGNFNIVLEVFKDVLIHNNDSDYESTLNSFITDIKNSNNNIYKQALLLKQNTLLNII
jgi:hypothetical protein